MPQIPSLHAWQDGEVITAARLNNDATIRTYANTYGMWADAACTVSVTHTYTASQAFSAGWTAGAACTVSSGGITVTGNSTITGTLSGVTTLTATTLTATTVAGTLSTAAQPNITSVGSLAGLTVASGGITVTGNSTITGTLSGVTTLSCTAITGVTSLSLTGNLAATGQVYSAGVTVQSVAGATVNWNNGNFQGLNWNSNGATIAFSNPQEGAVYYLRLVVGGGLGHNLAWPAAVDWTGTPLTSAPVSATTYLIRLLYDGTTYWADYTANT
jgi:hypothetical protein